MIGLTELLTGVFQPLATLVGELHTSDEELLTLKTKIFEIQMKAFTQAQEYETTLLKAKADIITAEAKEIGRASCRERV